MLFDSSDEALERLKKTHKDLTKGIYKQEEGIRFEENKAINLVIWYIASQLAIFLLSSHQASAHICRYHWLYFSVCFLLAVAFGLSFGTTIVKYLRIKFEQDKYYIDRGDNYVKMESLERNMGCKSEESLLMELEEDEQQRMQYEPDMFAVYQRYTHIGISASVLAAFTAAVLNTCYVCATFSK